MPSRRNVKELLVLTGDDPGASRGRARAPAELGFEDFVGYVVWVCEEALARGLLPHTNLGALSREDLARLREVTASQGLMLESCAADLVAHQASPTKDPALRLETIRAAGELRSRSPAASSSASASARRIASRRSRRSRRCTASTATSRR